MRTILSQIQHPSHYTGIEEGAIQKNASQMTLHLALAFPDLYEVGMSYLGQKILYAIVNSHPTWWAERVMAPEKESAEILRRSHLPLTTLESDTPLGELDLIGFSITHELCYTNVLYMLDLANIPLRASMRGNDCSTYPIVIAGGGALLGAEPLAPFMDLMVLGDGEEVFPKLLHLLEEAKAKKFSRLEFLRMAHGLHGIYVPQFYASQGETKEYVSILGDKKKPCRAVCEDIEHIPYPTKQVVPIGAVHNRLSIEIARGCTRGCRFCQAGMVYRPVRERSVSCIQTLLHDCLSQTGFEEVSFLALSTGDYSALKELSHKSLDSLQAQQISLSLPSQRVGSIDDEIIAKMADLRRTGMTLAPEAGSQRLRDVINKGISEEDILLHAQKLVEHGWRFVKLYFMIGLPTESDDDLRAIVDLCRKVRDCAGRGNPRLQVTCALSPFVPKPFTPFQWAEQISQEEILHRVYVVREGARKEKCITIRWHEPAVSHLEGILSRAGREMADCVEAAYRMGALFCNWMEHFTLDPWLKALDQYGLTSSDYIRERDLNEILPWDHLESGISKEFLQNEWKKALQCRVTSDCRYSHCHKCGACDHEGHPSPLNQSGTTELRIRNRLQKTSRDQNAHRPHFDETGKLILMEKGAKTPSVNPNLTKKVIQYRIWHTKVKEAAFLSQLELQSMLERAFRRSKIPLAFSMGFHPMPLLSFGRALPVGVESMAEWFSVTLCDFCSQTDLMRRLSPYLPSQIRIQAIDVVNSKTRTQSSDSEIFRFFAPSERREEVCSHFKQFFAQTEVLATFQTKKGPRTKDIRSLLKNYRLCDHEKTCLELHVDWGRDYLSPIKLCNAILGYFDGEKCPIPFSLIKQAQIFSDETRSF